MLKKVVKEYSYLEKIKLYRHRIFLKFHKNIKVFENMATYVDIKNFKNQNLKKYTITIKNWSERTNLIDLYITTNICCLGFYKLKIDFLYKLLVEKLRWLSIIR